MLLSPCRINLCQILKHDGVPVMEIVSLCWSKWTNSALSIDTRWNNLQYKYLLLLLLLVSSSPLMCCGWVSNPEWLEISIAKATCLSTSILSGGHCAIRTGRAFGVKHDNMATNTLCTVWTRWKDAVRTWMNCQEMATRMQGYPLLPA